MGKGGARCGYRALGGPWRETETETETGQKLECESPAERAPTGSLFFLPSFSFKDVSEPLPPVRSISALSPAGFISAFPPLQLNNPAIGLQ